MPAGLLLMTARGILVAASLVLLCVFAAPVDDQELIRSAATTEGVTTTTEELDFKDVPIFEKDRPVISKDQLPAASTGIKYRQVLRCGGKIVEVPPGDLSPSAQKLGGVDKDAQKIADGAVQPLDSQPDKIEAGEQKKEPAVDSATAALLQVVENVRATVAEMAGASDVSASASVQTSAGQQALPADDGAAVADEATKKDQPADVEEVSLDAQPVKEDAHVESLDSSKADSPAPEKAEAVQPAPEANPAKNVSAALQESVKADSPIAEQEPQKAEADAVEPVSAVGSVKENAPAALEEALKADSPVVETVKEVISAVEQESPKADASIAPIISADIPVVETVKEDAPVTLREYPKADSPVAVMIKADISTIEKETSNADAPIAPVVSSELPAAEPVKEDVSAIEQETLKQGVPVVPVISADVPVVETVKEDVPAAVQESPKVDSPAANPVKEDAPVASQDSFEADSPVVETAQETSKADAPIAPVTYADVPAAEPVKEDVSAASQDTSKAESPVVEIIKEDVPAAVQEYSKIKTPSVELEPPAKPDTPVGETVKDAPVAEQESLKGDAVLESQKAEADSTVAEPVKEVAKDQVEVQKEAHLPVKSESPVSVPVSQGDSVKSDAPPIAAEESIKKQAQPAKSDAPAELEKQPADVNKMDTQESAKDVPVADAQPESVKAVVETVKADAEAAPEPQKGVADAQPVKEDEPAVEGKPVDDIVEPVASAAGGNTNNGDGIDIDELQAGSKPVVSTDVVKDYTGYKIYRVSTPTEEAARWLLKFEDLPGIEFMADPRLLLRPRGMFVTSAADIMVAPDAAEYMDEALRQAHLPYEIIIDDVQEAIRNENPTDPMDADELTSRNGHRMTWERYHTIDDMDSFFEYLKTTFPSFVTVTEIGRSTEGRPIRAVRLSQSTGRKNKKAILIDAGIHAREWITPATLTYMVREIVENPEKYDCIMNEFDWLFIPVINPDGYAYTQTNDRMWRKTRSRTTDIVFRKAAEASLLLDRASRFNEDPVLDDAILERLRNKVIADKALSCIGVDANRNFDFAWLTGGSSRNPCSDLYAGPKAFSEPESKAVRDYILANKDQLIMYISLHAYSQMWLIPWGYTEKKPDDYSELYSLAKIGSQALKKVNGVSYLIGSIPDLLYVASGSAIDWAKGAAGIHYSYTLELRDAGRYGFLLPASQIALSGRETWAAMYASAIELAKRTYSDPARCPASF